MSLICIYYCLIKKTKILKINFLTHKFKKQIESWHERNNKNKGISVDIFTFTIYIGWLHYVGIPIQNLVSGHAFCFRLVVNSPATLKIAWKDNGNSLLLLIMACFHKNIGWTCFVVLPKWEHYFSYYFITFILSLVEV